MTHHSTKHGEVREHGSQRRKCAQCELIEAEKRIAELETELDNADRIIRRSCPMNAPGGRAWLSRPHSSRRTSWRSSHETSTTS